MRLKIWEIEEIKKAAKLVFGENVKVILFGSRLDDTKRGGDIDLYVISKDLNIRKRAIFEGLLQERLGEQKIDVIYSIDKGRKIEEIAVKGIEL